MKRLLCLIAILFCACGPSDIQMIPYSTARIGGSKKVGRGDTELKIFNNYEDCEYLVEHLNLGRGELAQVVAADPIGL